MPLPLHERTMADTTSSPPRAGDTLQRLSDAGAELHHPQIVSRSKEDPQVSNGEAQDGVENDVESGVGRTQDTVEDSEGGSKSAQDTVRDTAGGGVGSGGTGREDTRTEEERQEAERRYEENIEEEYAKREGGA